MEFEIDDNNIVGKLTLFTLRRIVEEGWLCNISMEGFDTYYDMSGQRSCQLVKTFPHRDFDTFPLYFGLVRYDYICFYKDSWVKLKEFNASPEKLYFKEESKMPAILGQITITQEMLKSCKITMEQNHVTINFKAFELRAGKNPRHESSN